MYANLWFRSSPKTRKILTQKHVWDWEPLCRSNLDVLAGRTQLKIQIISRAAPDRLAGRIWPAGRTLHTPAINRVFKSNLLQQWMGYNLNCPGGTTEKTLMIHYRRTLTSQEHYDDMCRPMLSPDEISDRDPPPPLPCTHTSFTVFRTLLKTDVNIAPLPKSCKWRGLKYIIYSNLTG